MLIAAASSSIAGNVAHALMNATAGSPAVAAAAAVVAPAVLLGSTHGVALLVRARTAGWAYWCTLAVTVALAGCAFGLSFDALRDLARRWAGYSDWASVLWPLSIDLSIAVSTLALLALAGAPKRADDAPACVDGAHHATADELIAAGATRLERDKVADVLAELESGTAPSTVARRLSVGYQTVARISDAVTTTNNGAPVAMD